MQHVQQYPGSAPNPQEAWVKGAPPWRLTHPMQFKSLVIQHAWNAEEAFGCLNVEANSIRPEPSHRISRAGQAFHTLSRMWKDAYLARVISLYIIDSGFGHSFVRMWNVGLPFCDDATSEVLSHMMLGILGNNLSRILVAEKERSGHPLSMQDRIGEYSCEVQMLETANSYGLDGWWSIRKKLSFQTNWEFLPIPKLDLEEGPGCPHKVWQDYVKEDLAGPAEHAIQLAQVGENARCGGHRSKFFCCTPSLRAGT